MPPTALTLALTTASVVLAPALTGIAAAEPPEPNLRPARAWYVATNGSNQHKGTLRRPLATIDVAIRRAHSGDTIFLRRGSYHQSVTVDKDNLTIRNQPRERVTLDGTSRVTGWRQSGSVWVRDGWTQRFDHSPTYSWGAQDSTQPNWQFVNPAHPMAAWPDMVFVEGKALRQVSSPSQVRAGTFAVDYNASKLYLGTNPSGREVRASTIAKAVSIRGSNTVLRGLTIRGYGSSVPHMGSVTVERPGARLRRLVVTQNATVGIGVLADNARLSHVQSSRNGMLGIHASQAYNMVLDHVRVARNNVERFNQAPSAGGMKVHRSRNITVRHSAFLRNHGTGAWFDVSNYNIKFYDNAVRRNAGHGVFLEISDTALVADNAIARNGGHGLQIDNVGHVRVWNNSFLGNARPLNIVQDDRLASKGTFPGYDPRRPKPDPTVPWITRDIQVVNNVISNPTSAGNCLLCVEDYTKQRSAEQMGIFANGNLYRRAATHAPKWLVVWSSGQPNPHVYETLKAFRASTGQEARGRAARTDVLTELGWPTSYTNDRASQVSLGLPADIAKYLGKKAGARHLGPWRR